MGPPPVRPPRASARPSADRGLRHQRPRSIESLRLDLDGLDLGGNPAFTAPVDNDAALRHARTRSNTAQSTSIDSKPAFRIPVYDAIDADPGRVCDSCAHHHEPLTGIEDSFSLHLRAECSDYREILSSHTVLNAAAKKEQRMRNTSIDTLDPSDLHRSRQQSISHGQVLGGFASLGLQPESAPEPPAPIRKQPVRTVTKGSTDESEAPATPIEWRDSFGALGSSAYEPPPKWAHLTARPGNPLEPLDVLSIEEMGLHSLDIGSLNDWEGCKLSAEILCPINGHQRIEWSVAQTNRRNKKWVVVPNATLTCGITDALPPAAQAERTVIVSNRSLWLDEGEAALAQPDAAAPSSQRVQGLGAARPAHRSSMPFSGKAGFELRLLRPTSGKICPPIYLANASTHRYLQNYRHGSHVQPTQIQDRVHTKVDQYATNPAAPVYSTLRRSRSRPYLRQPHAPLRRSRSKPYLRVSAQQQSALQPAPMGFNPELFAPSLPGDPLLRTQPGESWPSARARRSNSVSSFSSDSSSEAGSATSEDEAALSATNTRESTTGSTSSTSYDQLARMNRQDSAATAIPMGIRAARSVGALRSITPDSSASRGGVSNTSEMSASLAGWQPSSYEKQRYLKQGMANASSEVDSWQGTSPTTASASSVSATSKQSSKSKGLQKAFKKKDKMLSSWFKRRAENGASSLSVSPGTDSEKPRPIVTVTADSSGLQPPVGTNQAGASGAASQSTPLTETALESFQRAMFRPASPDSTIMGSRRGSEALTQKAAEPAAHVAGHGGGMRSVRDEVAAQGGSSGSDNRLAVNSALSQVYGWDEQQAASKVLRRPSAGANAPAPMSFEDLDEESALLGLDAVPAGALTMLIPLPLIGRNQVQDAVRYMRINFCPFKSFADDFETAPAGLGHAGSPNSEAAEPGLSQSVSTGSNHSTERAPIKPSELSIWRRKLGLSSHRSGGSGGGTVNTVQPSQGGGGSGARSTLDAAQPSPPLVANKFEPFRVTAIVHDVPWTSSRPPAQIDPRLPDPGTFPVVLGYCNTSQGLEMVPEGWGALKLAGVPVPTKPDGSPLDGVHPLHAVSDLITAACVAVMDV